MTRRYLPLILCLMLLGAATAQDELTLDQQSSGSLGAYLGYTDQDSSGLTEVPLGSVSDGTRPSVLRSPLEAVEQLPPPLLPTDHTTDLFEAKDGAPWGFTGPSGIAPTEHQTSQHFVPVEDRWRSELPSSDRYGKGHPINDDYLGVKGAWWDPYNQNVLKGDYPILGQHTFMKLGVKSLNLFEGRQLPTPTTPFEATQNPGTAAFFGDPDQFLFQSYNFFSIDLFHGNTSFKPNDWRLRVNAAYNMNNLTADELAVVNPDVPRRSQSVSAVLCARRVVR